MRNSFWAAVVVGVIVADIAEPAAIAAPNILLILADDQSWNGTSVRMDPNNPASQSDFYQTPRLEQLASQGMRFSNAYSAAALCSPTRAALLTGRSPAQVHMTGITVPGYLGEAHDGFPLTPEPWFGLETSQPTLPKVVRQADPNYYTAHVGKWHVYPGPTQLGFAKASAGTSFTAQDPAGAYGWAGLTNTFMEESVASNKPFFIQLSQFAVHAPIVARPSTIEKYQNLPPGQVHSDPVYAAFTEDLDNSLGMLLDKIDQLGIADNTYVIYASDNGASAGISSSSPLTSGKNHLWEGGIRVPLIVRGPGIDGGSVSHVPTTSADIYSTIYELVGNLNPLPVGVEGASLAPVLFNGGSLPSGQQYLEREYAEKGALFFHSPHYNDSTLPNRSVPTSAVRLGDYKLVLQYGGRGVADKVYLFNLAQSLTESSQLNSPLNLANQLPEKRDEMLGLLHNWLESTDAILAYDVTAPIHVAWRADEPGSNTTLWGAPAEITRWRATTDVDNYQREIWTTSGWSGANTPRVALASAPHQPGLGKDAFRFTPNNLIVTASFHVGDAGDAFVGNLLPASQIDHDRSATFELWVKFNSLTAEQTLFETGHSTEGLSLTVGDADANGQFNDLRFRALGDDGQSITTTVALNQFVNPTSEFIHIVGVINDSPNDRYTEIYVNGALLGRSNGVLGPAGSIDWDGYQNLGDAFATIGKVTAANLGGNSGPAATRPFSGGGLSADLSQFHFRNYALSGAEVLNEYNQRLAPVGWGVLAAGGNAFLATERPSNVSENAFETGGSMTVLHERLQTLTSPLAVDIAPAAGASYAINGAALPGGNLASGQEVASYLVHFDALAGAATGLVQGTFTFAAPVLGLIVNDATLSATDKALGAVGRYSVSGKALEIDDMATLSLSADLKTLTISLTATASDFFELRVLTAAPNLIPGDYDGDGVVDADDYQIWKRDFGTSSYLADGNGDGVVDAADYTVWREHLGSQLPGVAAGSAVPEPSAAAIIVALAIAGVLVVGRR